MRRSRAGEVFAGISPAGKVSMTCSISVEVSFHFIGFFSWGVCEMNEKKSVRPHPPHISRGHGCKVFALFVHDRQLLAARPPTAYPIRSLPPPSRLLQIIMTIKLRCPECDKPFTARDSEIGSRIECPKCETLVRVPNR